MGCEFTFRFRSCEVKYELSEGVLVLAGVKWVSCNCWTVGVPTSVTWSDCVAAGSSFTSTSADGSDPDTSASDPDTSASISIP